MCYENNYCVKTCEKFGDLTQTGSTRKPHFTVADGKEYVLAELDDFDREIALTRQNKEFMAFLDRRAQQTMTIPLEEVKRQLGI